MISEKIKDHYDDYWIGKICVLENGDEITYHQDWVEIDGNRLDKYIVCPICNTNLRTITNTHLWRSHQLTVERFRELYPQCELQSPFSKYLHGYHSKRKTYEDMYGQEKASTLKETRRVAAINQMKDENQIDIRRVALAGIPKSEEAIQKQIETKYGDLIYGYRERALSYYGEECQSCGSNDDLVVHHKDHNNFGNNNAFSNHKMDNLEVLCRKCHGKTHSQGGNHFKGKSEIEKGFAMILSGLHQAFGLNLDDENLRDTPSRVARSYLEMLQGIDQSKVAGILNQAFPSHYTGMVVIANISCYSMCPHHFLPVKYNAYFGYIPQELVLGLSKIPRFIKLICQAPILQETVTESITDRFMEIVKPQGCAVILQGFHMCMGCRGVEMPEASTITTSVKGIFNESDVKQEFFDTIKAQGFK